MKVKDNILVIDDDEIVLEIISTQLKSLGFSVKSTTSADYGLKILDKIYDSISLIVCDIYMSNMNGIEFNKTIKQDERLKYIPLIFLTNDTKETTIKKCLSTGAVDIINKGENTSLMLLKCKTHIQYYKYLKKYIDSTNIDSLTGCKTRYYLYEVLDKKIHRHRRNDTDIFGIILIDLDDFKHINDTFGHNVGDDVLKYVSNKIRSNVRNEDVVVRYGGDEFILVLDLESVEDLYNVKKMINSIFVLNDFYNKDVDISLSIGSSMYNRNVGIDECIRLADQEMYYDKSSKKKLR